VGEFEVEAADPVVPAPFGLASVSGAVEESGAFDLFGIDAPADTFVAVRTSNVAPADMNTWLWALQTDGFTTHAVRGLELPEGGYEEPLVVFPAEEAGTHYVRVGARGGDGGPGHTYDLDVTEVPPGDAFATVDEVEPNDATDEWQNLGVLSAGQHSLTGVAETAGHDPDSYEHNGDLDVFRFAVAEDAAVYLKLEWPSADDFDAIVYDDTAGDTVLGFNENNVLTLAMATFGQPETVMMILTAGTPYVLEVTNWEGDPGASWSLEVVVLGDVFGG